MQKMFLSETHLLHIHPIVEKDLISIALFWIGMLCMLGSIEGYSANHRSGHLALKTNVMELLEGWDETLDSVFWEI